MVAIDTASSRKRLCPHTMFVCGEKLLAQGGRERELSCLNKEATLTLKYHTVAGVEQEYVCGGVEWPKY